MKKLASRAYLMSVFLALTSAAAQTAPSAESSRAPDNVSGTQDPYAWLEDVTGDRALQWVKGRNARTAATIASTPEFKRLESSIRAILDSDTRIPTIQKMGAWYYNFWRDASNPRGIYRRTTLEEYRKPQPRWETVLDIDALNSAEKETWVLKNVTCLRPEYRRCLVELSRGGADATVTREFDLERKDWVKDGFFRPEAKGELRWIDIDNVYVVTDFGPGSLTSSGYPRVAKQWARGTPMSSATLVYEGKANDVEVSAYHDATPGFERDFVTRTPAFFQEELYLRSKDDRLSRIDIPSSSRASTKREWLTLQLRDPWTVGDKTYAAGSFLATKLDDFMAGKRNFEVLFAPTEHTSMLGSIWTRTHLLVTVLDDVKARVIVLTPTATGWERRELGGIPAAGTVGVEPVDVDEADAVWLISTDYLTPTTFSLLEIGGQAEPLKADPAFFDGSRHTIEQHFAMSKDGTRIPYFLVRQRNLRFDGGAPTLLYGYGGFEVSQLPHYDGKVGKAWLERGGVYVVANIRGGGEYGPSWHQAALKENRHKAYEDFAAVAQDLITRKVTSPSHLGAWGSSNGGLLTGNMLTQYPQAFGAVVVQAPLLDMKRYSHLLAGASWMAEYGDPDKPEEWQFIRTFSPYHLFDPKKPYPPVLFMTSTRDDRVHPGHARKMAARMIDAGKDVTYYENVEGGHGGSASNAQAAYMNALAFTFLSERLGSTATH